MVSPSHTLDLSMFVLLSLVGAVFISYVVHSRRGGVRVANLDSDAAQRINEHQIDQSKIDRSIRQQIENASSDDVTETHLGIIIQNPRPTRPSAKAKRKNLPGNAKEAKAESQRLWSQQVDALVPFPVKIWDKFVNAYVAKVGSASKTIPDIPKETSQEWLEALVKSQQVYDGNSAAFHNLWSEEMPEMPFPEKVWSKNDYAKYLQADFPRRHEPASRQTLLNWLMWTRKAEKAYTLLKQKWKYHVQDFGGAEGYYLGKESKHPSTVMSDHNYFRYEKFPEKQFWNFVKIFAEVQEPIPTKVWQDWLWSRIGTAWDKHYDNEQETRDRRKVKKEDMVWLVHGLDFLVTQQLTFQQLCSVWFQLEVLRRAPTKLKVTAKSFAEGMPKETRDVEATETSALKSNAQKCASYAAILTPVMFC